MEALRGLVLLLSVSTALCVFRVPLKVFSTEEFSSSVGLLQLQTTPGNGNGNGLSLASDPSGVVNFLDMVNNLRGDSGRGYYIEMAIGTPGQTVGLSKSL